MGPAVRYWAVAASVLAHAVVIALMLVRLQPEETGAQAAGLGGIEVSMGPAGAAPGGEAVPVTPELPEAEAVEAPTAHEVEPEVDQQVAEAPEAAATPIEPETVPAAGPLETAARPLESAETADAVQPVQPQPAEAVETVETREVAQEVAEVDATDVAALKPPPKPRHKPKPELRQVTDQPRPAPEPQPMAEPAKAPELAAAVLSGAAGKAGTKDKPDVGSGDSTQGGGLPGSGADYLAVLQAWLERHKEYPRRAQMRRQEGTALLRFVIDRRGRVLSYRLERSSGHALLDREVEEMIARAQPLPPMPEEMHRTRLELVVPVQFFLR